MYTGLDVKYLLLSSDFNANRILLKDFRKILKYQTSKITSSRSQVAPNGQTDMTELIFFFFFFRNFANAPKENILTNFSLY